MPVQPQNCNMLNRALPPVTSSEIALQSRAVGEALATLAQRKSRPKPSAEQATQTAPKTLSLSALSAFIPKRESDEWDAREVLERTRRAPAVAVNEDDATVVETASGALLAARALGFKRR
jgi:hypothetical protein